MNEKYEVVKFEQDNLILDVNVSPNEDTVWLSKEDHPIRQGITFTPLMAEVADRGDGTFHVVADKWHNDAHPADATALAAVVATIH